MPALRPHIMVFMTDDHGQWASSVYGNHEIRTPTLQWLADTGVTMEQAYTTSPVCSPARASFWTGRIPSAHGIHDYLEESTRCQGKFNHAGITQQPHLGHLFKQQGYSTAMFGKWHVGGGGAPVSGFDSWFSSLLGTNAKAGQQLFSDGTTTVEWSGHQSTVVVDRAIQYLHKSRRMAPEQPVFLYVGLTDTHTPHNNAPSDLCAHYHNASFLDIPDEDFSPAHGSVYFGYDKKSRDGRNKLIDYYASVEFVDQQVNRIIKAWDGLGQLDNTVILYTSDHGHMNGHHGLHTKGNATRPQNFLQDSILVPAVWRWPKRFRLGARSTQPVDHCDVFATLLDIAGSDIGAAVDIDSISRPGRSFTQSILCCTGPWRQDQICEYGNARMIYDGRYKLIKRSPSVSGPVNCEFYDLHNDPRERNSFHPSGEIVTTLAQKLDQYFKQYASAGFDGFVTSAIINQFNSCEPWAV